MFYFAYPRETSLVVSSSGSGRGECESTGHEKQEEGLDPRPSQEWPECPLWDVPLVPAMQPRGRAQMEQGLSWVRTYLMQHISILSTCRQRPKCNHIGEANRRREYLWWAWKEGISFGEATWHLSNNTLLAQCWLPQSPGHGPVYSFLSLFFPPLFALTLFLLFFLFICYFLRKLESCVIFFRC